MKKLALIFATLLMSSGVFAGSDMFYNNSHFKTDGFASQQQALDAGFDLVDTLNSMTASQQKMKLSVLETSAHDLVIDRTKVNIQQFARTRGDIQYRAIVDVDYHYTAHVSDN